jgi:hypothetical protein
MPALKRMIKVEALPGALKRSFPRMNAGAPTTNADFPVLTQTLQPGSLVARNGPTEVGP